MLNPKKGGETMFDYIKIIGQSEISQDIISGDYCVSYHNKWGKDIKLGLFKTQGEAIAVAEQYSKGFDSFSDNILEELID